MKSTDDENPMTHCDAVGAARRLPARSGFRGADGAAVGIFFNLPLMLLYEISLGLIRVLLKR